MLRFYVIYLLSFVFYKLDKTASLTSVMTIHSSISEVSILYN